VNDLVQVCEARPPLERDVSVKKLFVLLNVANSEYLKSIFVVVTNHVRVGVFFGGRVVKGRSAGTHRPGLVRAFRTPSEDVGTRVSVESFGQAPHDTLFNQVSCEKRESR
jgi:hypothetical protein